MQHRLLDWPSLIFDRVFRGWRGGAFTSQIFYLFTNFPCSMVLVIFFNYLQQYPCSIIDWPSLIFDRVFRGGRGGVTLTCLCQYAVELSILYYWRIMLCSVDGGWSSWSAWGGCSETCGAGVEERVRRCDSPSPRFGGRSCRGVDSERRPCKLIDCQGKFYVLFLVLACCNWMIIT